MKNDHERVEELLNQALECKPDQRAAFLAGACGGDLDLRQRVETLLSAADEADGFLPDTPTPRTTPLSEGPGTMIGRYKLLQNIGEGGMGVVYMAEQKEPVKRRVALKIIKLGMDTRQVVARFEAERQALAMMDHQNIARVLDAGATDTGRPYFVMELVHGVPITDYCDQNRLTTGERLGLFMAVCLAVQHAHQKGVIHRDIKPSNILVTLHDSVPVPKVIDFGIAKATQQELTEKTLFTQFRQMIGTPAYMSPEQAEVSGLDIDTRADIYSLGVLLYELLTSKTPLDEKELLSGGYDEIRRRIKEEEPLRPSTRARTLQDKERTTVAEHRKVDPSRFGSELKGDLDWIVMKALEKDRTRRYDTAKGFANDVRRYLSHQPVEAAAPSLWYRSRKFVVRHRAAVATVSLITLALTSGTVVSTWQAIRATRASEREQAAHENALDALDAARAAEDRANREAEAARRNLYASDMLLAQQAVNASNLRRARELLERHRPENTDLGAEDLRGWEWNWLRDQLRSGKGELLAKLPGAVFGLSLSPDGRYVAASTLNGVMKVFETRTGREIAELPEGGGMPKKPVFFEKENRFIYNHAGRQAYLTNGFLKVWNVDSGEVDYVFENDQGIGAKAVSPDGTKALFNAVDGQLHLLDLNTGTVLWDTPLVRRGNLHTADSFLFSRPAGDEYLIGEENGEISFYSAATGEKTRKIAAHSQALSALSMSPDGRLIASANYFSGMNSIKLWDNRTLNLVGTLSGHSGWVCDLEFTSDGRRLVSASADQTIRLWDLETQAELAVYRGQPQEVWEVEITPDGQFIIAGGKDGSIYTWEIDAQPVPESGIVASGVRSFAVSAVGNVIALQGTNRTVQWGGIGPGIRLENASFVGTNNTLISLSTDGQRLLAGKVDGTLSVYDVDAKQRLHSWPVFDSMVLGGAFIASRNAILASDLNHRLALVGPGSDPGSIIWSAPLDEFVLQNWRQVFALSPDERFVVLRNAFGELMLKDVSTGQETRSARNPSPQPMILGLAFSPDGQTLATADASGVVGLWDVATLERYAVLAGHRNSSQALAFLPQGNRLVSGGDAESGVILWDLNSRQELLRLPVEGHIVQLDFCSGWNLLLGLTATGELYAWRAPP